LQICGIFLSKTGLSLFASNTCCRGWWVIHCLGAGWIFAENLSIRPV